MRKTLDTQLLGSMLHPRDLWHSRPSQETKEIGSVPLLQRTPRLRSPPQYELHLPAALAPSESPSSGACAFLFACSFHWWLRAQAAHFKSLNGIMEGSHFYCALYIFKQLFWMRLVSASKTHFSPVVGKRITHCTETLQHEERGCWTQRKTAEPTDWPFQLRDGRGHVEPWEMLPYSRDVFQLPEWVRMLHCYVCCPP